MSVDYVAKARSLLGARFLPQGRNPRLGIDCLGLVLLVYGIEASKVRRDYRLRGHHLRAADLALAAFFDRVPGTGCVAGDLLLARVAVDQIHFAVQCGTSFIHADAGLRLVVEVPGSPPWPMAAAYRRHQGT